MNMEEYKKYVNNTCEKIKNKLDVNSEEFDFFINLVRTFNQVCIERNNLEQALNEIEEYFNRPEWEKDNLPSTSHCEAKEDILEIINKAKGSE